KKRTFRVDSNPAGLKAVVESPRQVMIGQVKEFIVKISSGRSQANDSKFTVYPASEGLAFLEASELNYTKESLDSNGQTTSESGTLSANNYENILLPKLNANETISILIPYETGMASDTHHVKVIVNYVTPNSKRHMFNVTSSISTAIPLKVANSII